MQLLYNDLVLAHSRSRANRRIMEDFTLQEKGHNPSCGDEITLQLKIEDDIVQDAAFHGEGCAISLASASIMCDLIRGQHVDQAKVLADTFIGMIRKEISAESPQLEQLDDGIIFQNISNMPARVKCAVLGWHTLKETI